MSETSQKVAYDKEGNAHELVDFANDYSGSKIGMWLFLFTELMLFGGLFLTFMYYFYAFSDDFVSSSGGLNLLLGGINTFVLLVSTYFMGIAFLSIKKGHTHKARIYIALTIVLALIFLGIKYFEWMAEIHHGIYPNSEILGTMSHGKELFFGLYFTMTGLHGLHIIIGIGLMIWTMMKISNKSINKENYVVLENIALYWDLVHLIWVFLFPIFYMIGA